MYQCKNTTKKTASFSASNLLARPLPTSSRIYWRRTAPEFFIKTHFYFQKIPSIKI